MRMLFFTKIACICLLSKFIVFAEGTRMAYSDLISSDLREFLYNDAVSLNKNIDADITNLSVSSYGSLPIIEDFLSEDLDICILVLPEESEFPTLDDDKIIKIPFGYKSSIIVVNAENPLSEITIDELANIFGDSSTISNLISWRDFGISSFSTNSIKTYSVKEDAGISSDLFRYKVLNEKPFSSSVTFDIQENVQRIMSQDKASIGVFPNYPENPNLKVLFIAQDEESIAYGPSIDNIYYSDYPIRLAFYIVYNLEDTERLYPLINILLSDSVADILGDNELFPIPKVIREKLVIDLQLYLQENKK